jgi:putative FmdB family regulatory protein
MTKPDDQTRERMWSAHWSPTWHERIAIMHRVSGPDPSGMLDLVPGSFVMPTYEYVCTRCGKHVEVVQSMSAAPLTECAACGGPLRKVFAPIGIVFKGSGFYRTDSRDRSSTKKDGAAAAAKDSTKDGAKEGTTKSPTTSPSSESSASSSKTSEKSA